MKKILLATLMFIPASLWAATLPSNIEGYIPTDRFVPGANVKVNFGDDFAEAAKPIQEAVSKASPEVLQDIQKNSKPDEPLPFDERLKINKADYDKYIAAWNNRKIVPIEQVQVQLVEAGEGKWKVQAFTMAGNGAMAPLPLHNLVYDGAKDVWTTPNGDLVRKEGQENVSFSKDNLFGEWSGPQWTFEEKDSFSTVIENFAMGKAPKTGDVFLIYRLIEITPNNQVVSQTMYVIRIEAKDLKEDPLKKQAREEAKKK